MKILARAVLCSTLLAASTTLFAADAPKSAPAPKADATAKGPTERECLRNRAAVRKADKDGTAKDDNLLKTQAICQERRKKREANMNKTAPADPTQR